jgi:hypothetical protein
MARRISYITTTVFLPDVNLLYFHFQEEIQTSVELMNHDQRQQLELLQSYVANTFEEEFIETRSLFAKEKVTRKTAKYLFRPRTLLVSDKGALAEGLRQTGFLRMEISESWELEAEYWAFDGAFTKKERYLELVESSIPKSPVKINTLKFYPFQYTDEDTRVLLQRRGEMVWSCRELNSVLYTGMDINQETFYVSAQSPHSSASDIASGKC